MSSRSRLQDGELILRETNGRRRTNLDPGAQRDVRREITERLIDVGRKIKVRVDVPRGKDISPSVRLHRLDSTDLHDPVDLIRLHALIHSQSAQEREDDGRLKVHVQVKLRRGRRGLALRRERIVGRDRPQSKTMGSDCRLDARNRKIGSEGIREKDGHV